jgi:hypothetical protein
MVTIGVLIEGGTWITWALSKRGFLEFAIISILLWDVLKQQLDDQSRRELHN